MPRFDVYPMKPRTMTLELEASPPITDPSAEDIRAGIDSIHNEDNTFAILSLDEMTYIQARGSPMGGFTLEYQEGTLDRRYRTVAKTVSKGAALEAFLSYRHQDGQWQNIVDWERDDCSEDDASTSGKGCLSLIALTAGMIGVLWWLGSVVV